MAKLVGSSIRLVWLAACLIAVLGTMDPAFWSGEGAAQSYATASITIQYPSAPSATYNVPISPGTTVEDAMKVASVMSPSFKWTAIWYGSLASYQVIAFNDTKNDDPVDANSRYWQFCAGPKGYQQMPSTRGISLFGLAPDDKITWQLVKSGGLNCPAS
jgi:hypothetical protein